VLADFGIWSGSGCNAWFGCSSHSGTAFPNHETTCRKLNKVTPSQVLLWRSKTKTNWALAPEPDLSTRPCWNLNLATNFFCPCSSFLGKRVLQDSYTGKRTFGKKVLLSCT